MEMSLSEADLRNYVRNQISSFFPDGEGKGLEAEYLLFSKAIEEALRRCDVSFSQTKDKFYFCNGESCFNHLHMDQYTQFLYFLGNSLWKLGGDQQICSKCALLGRALSGCWISYKCDLPNVFLLVHPVGTVLGNKGIKYGNYMVVLQNVTINGASNIAGGLRLGECLYMAAGSKIIGGGYVGNRVSIGVNTSVRNPTIEGNRIVFRDDKTGAVVSKSSSSCQALKYFYVK